jgi:hypothetical protein
MGDPAPPAPPLDEPGREPAPGWTGDAVRGRIQSWLLGEGWELAEKDHAEALWLLEARDGGGRHLIVGQKRGKADQVILEGAVVLSEPHQQSFEALAPEARQELLWDLRFTLLGLGVEFQGVQEPFRRITLGQRIYFDGLTKDGFLQRVTLVRNAILATIWTFARRLNVTPAAEGAGPGGIN